MWPSRQRHGASRDASFASAVGGGPHLQTQLQPAGPFYTNPVYERQSSVAQHGHRTITLPFAQTMRERQPSSQGNVHILLPQYTKPNPVAAKPALTRRTVFQRPAQQQQAAGSSAADFHRGDERASLSKPSARVRVLQLDMVTDGESSTEPTIRQTNVNLPGTYATATSNNGDETLGSTVTDAQADVNGNYATLDDDHARYETSSFVHKRQSDTEYSQVLSNSQPYLQPRALLLGNNDYASPLPHATTCEAGTYATLKSGGNSYAVPFALAMDADDTLTPASAPGEADDGNPLGWGAEAPRSAFQENSYVGIAPPRAERPYTQHVGVTETATQAKGSRRSSHRALLFLTCILLAGAIAGAVVGFALTKESSGNEAEGSDKAQSGSESTNSDRSSSASNPSSFSSSSSSSITVQDTVSLRS